MPSFEMLKEILEQINFSRFAINNIDMTIISQKINISSKREVIEINISKLLSLDENKINLKGKSVDKLGIIGNNEASAAFVSISLSNA
jgi:2-C-methyl-D-erythritol 4-phosphate cytidylyltransferase/2-C-methyl-D-erythritol 2,4-cyclodiphosphate synthase